MRAVPIHLLGLLVTLALYCLLVPQARRELLAVDVGLADKLAGLGVRAVCIYVCCAFVYLAFFRTRKRRRMPEDGAYGGYRDDDPAPP
jgi:hypothetical protein